MVTKAPRHTRQEFLLPRRDAIDMGMFENDPPGYTPRRPLLREGRGKPFVPPQLFKRGHLMNAVLNPISSFSIQFSIQRSAFSIARVRSTSATLHAWATQPRGT